MGQFKPLGYKYPAEFFVAVMFDFKEYFALTFALQP